jgi:hypothetical protein
VPDFIYVPNYKLCRRKIYRSIDVVAPSERRLSGHQGAKNQSRISSRGTISKSDKYRSLKHCPDLLPVSTEDYSKLMSRSFASSIPNVDGGMKTDGIFSVPFRSVFYIFPSVFVFARSRFRICGSRKWCFPFVSE